MSRDYRIREPNGFRDFSHLLGDILKRLDDEQCDGVLFSLYSIDASQHLDILSLMTDLRHIGAVFLEEFLDETNRIALANDTYIRTGGHWIRRRVTQKFATLVYTKKFERETLTPFIDEARSARTLGNCTLLLCGESNVVRYSKHTKAVDDRHGYVSNLPQGVDLILNPVHDKMTRFEMQMKRRFLSSHGRTVVSVWNKGKVSSSGRSRDGKGPPWAAFHDGQAVPIRSLERGLGVEQNTMLGILDIPPRAELLELANH